MTTPSSVNFTAGTPETILDPPEPALASELARAEDQPVERRREAFAQVAATWPRSLDAWASLAEDARDPIERYAYARVGYHRGLDALRAAGWRGSGYVRWARPDNRGFLRCLDALRLAAAEIGEIEEENRCAIFLRQLDPEWPPPGRSA